MKNKIIRKVFMNKNNKQWTVTLPKKKMKSLDPTIKFGEDLFVEIKVVRRMKK